MNISSTIKPHPEAHKEKIEPNRCIYCNKTFSQSGNLKVHLRIHLGEKPFPCKICGRAFVAKGQLRNHERTHTGEKPFLCSECGRGFTSQSSFHKHELSHREEKVPPQELSSTAPGYECDICHSHFASSEVMTRHRKYHPHMQPDKRHKCSFCSYSTDHTTSLKDHVMKHTQLRPYQCTVCEKSFIQRRNLKIHLMVHTGERPFQCMECGKGFKRKMHLNQHERTHTGEKPFLCSECGEGFSRRDVLKKHVQTHLDQTPEESPQELSSNISGHECDVCHSRFSCLEVLKRHKRIHPHMVPDRRYKCTLCSYSTDHSTSLKGHIMKHLKLKPYKCTLCDKAFAQNAHLRTHLRIHTGEKPFQCEMCGKGFSEKRNLVLHERVHTGEKPFLCLECGEAFATWNLLKKHKSTHIDPAPSQLQEVPLKELSGNISGYECDICHLHFSSLEVMTRHRKCHPHMEPDREHKCSICSYSTHLAVSLKRHELKHAKIKPYKCMVCDKTFTRDSHLKSHLRTHTGEKPFQCETCKRSFTEKTHLNIHQRMHTGEKPFLCSTCGKGFARPQYLKQHQKIHNSQNPLKELSSTPEADSAKNCDVPLRAISPAEQSVSEASDAVQVFLPSHCSSEQIPTTLEKNVVVQPSDSFLIQYLKQHQRTHNGQNPLKELSSTAEADSAENCDVPLRTIRPAEQSVSEASDAVQVSLPSHCSSEEIPTTDACTAL